MRGSVTQHANAKQRVRDGQTEVCLGWLRYLRSFTWRQRTKKKRRKTNRSVAERGRDRTTCPTGSNSRCDLRKGTFNWSQVSLWPVLPSQPPISNSTSRIKLVAANGSSIKSFGYLSRQIKIGGKFYIYAFLNAKIAKPILSMDFLQRFEMTTNLNARKLLHSGISTPFRETFSKVSGVNLVQDALHQVRTIIEKYP